MKLNEKLFCTKQRILSKQWTRILSRFNIHYALVGGGIIYLELGMDFFRQAKNFEEKALKDMLINKGYLK